MLQKRVWIFSVDRPANIAWYQGAALVFTSASPWKSISSSQVVKKMSSIQCSFWTNDDLWSARDNSKLCEPALSLPLASLDHDVTHLSKVGARGTKTSASHRLQHFPEYKLILNQSGRCGVMNAENKKMTICPRHCRQFTRLQELTGQRQHPLHKAEIKFPN